MSLKLVRFIAAVGVLNWGAPLWAQDDSGPGGKSSFDALFEQFDALSAEHGRDPYSRGFKEEKMTGEQFLGVEHDHRQCIMRFQRYRSKRSVYEPSVETGEGPSVPRLGEIELRENGYVLYDGEPLLVIRRDRIKGRLKGTRLIDLLRLEFDGDLARAKSVRQEFVANGTKAVILYHPDQDKAYRLWCGKNGLVDLVEDFEYVGDLQSPKTDQTGE